MNENGITISGDLDWSFDRMAREMPEIETSALKSGAMMLKEKMKENLVSKFPAASKPVRIQTKNGYLINSQEPLTEGIRQTKTENGRVKVHALGSGKGGSSTFITRFYENDTQQRYNKNYKGKKLNKRRFTKNLTGVHFFQDTINAYMEKVTKHIGNVITGKLSIIFDE